ncbi:hypothetical protein DFQ01_10631 [Paenibacillus cellulosilyticus]|uniref:DUF6199 domain-containing protein n=1 Tax=Paenibacillus cellulosilyticus TaxID=375489 RepID=A0A2V2YUH1_9BACL|nr:DUF6199 family natural product biosynthesis protein [Paenibacillus cellulosilyticus]PWW04750.1 hypothetical protein DFQ01_10631 [Paenibacillus cellulosilyticus]QKS45875.1 hypothetical protein HUB94_16560 [Paenibacillus cellulosilyticus]
MFGFVGFLFVIIGILNIAFPKVGWYMQYGWQFKNAEPSDAALVMARIGGVIAIIIGLFLIFGGFPI